MMELSHGWFETLNCSVIDQQQLTSVTKHDLNLLHKKIIATDLIVQKYQDANKGLLRLQTENDDLRQQIEQITNECCIFGKQVTECIQECDHLKEQIEILNSEKRELNEQLRLLQTENTNNYHEIMVLRQYESLRETNDQLSKTVERQQKQITKLQLQVQRKSPIVYKPTKDPNEPSETDLALKSSQRSVLELKLALGRLMNFIQQSNIEVPTSLRIRPVLKAHDINDEFLEREGEFVLQPVKTKTKRKVSKKPVVQNDADDDDDDDDDHGDFIDVTHNPVQPEPVNKPIPPVPVIESTSKSSSRQLQKKIELPKAKPPKKSSTKSRRKKDESISDDPTGKLDDLASQLDNALSQTTPQEPTQILPHISSFLSDDEDEDRIHKSDKQPSQALVYNPISSQYSSIPLQPLRSSITIIGNTKSTISTNISFFSDDEHDEHAQEILSRASSIIEQQPISESIINQKNMPSLQVDSITPMEVETPVKSTSYMSFLSEDDEDNRPITPIATPLNEQPPFIYQEYISSSDVNVPTLNNEANNTVQQSDTPIIDIILPKSLPSNKQDSLSNSADQLKSSTAVNILDSKRIDIVLRLLNILTHPPIPLKRLRLIQHRVPEKQVTLLSDTTANDTHKDHAITPIVETNITINDSMPTEERLSAIDETKTLDQLLIQDQMVQSTKSTAEPIIDNSVPLVPVPEVQESIFIVENITAIIPEAIIVNETGSESVPESDSQLASPMEQQTAEGSEESNTKINEIPPKPIEYDLTNDKQPTAEISEESITTINEIPQKSIECDLTNDKQPTAEISEENITKINEIPQKPIECDLTNDKQPIQSSSSNTNLPEPVSSSILGKPSKQTLKPFQISLITRLLNVLTKLPVKPIKFPMPYPIRKQKRKIITNKPPVVHPDRTSRLATRMQTRSLTSIRTCIARCNQPAATNRKRTATESIASLPPIPKRMRSTRIEQQNPTNEYAIITKFLNSSSKEINDDLKKFLQQKLQEDLVLFNDTIYRIFSDLLFSKCDIILRLVKQLHSYEESMKLILVHIHSQSAVFQQYFISKSRKAFEFEIKQQPISNNRIKILNRLFFLACSVFATSPVNVYARLFDIGYYLSHDILIDALKIITNTCSSLISTDAQTSSSNVLLHQLLFDILQKTPFNISLEYMENLLTAYHRYVHDQEDLIRCFILISRHQSWSWCSNELCSKFLFPLLNKTDDQNQQLIIVLTILQYVIFIYKDNQDFKQDNGFHDQTKQLLQSLKTINSSETIVRDKILFVIHTCC